MSDTRTRPPILLRPIAGDDPRAAMEPQALVLASRNAYPLVAQPRRGSDALGLAAGGAVALLLGGVTFWSMSGHRGAPRPLPAAPPPVEVAAIPHMPLPAPLPAMPQPVPLPPSATVPGPVTAAAPDAAHSPVMVYDGSQADAVPAPAVAGPAGAAEAKAGPNGENEQFAARVGGSADVATAEQMHDPATTVTQGTLIPAVLETAIDTDLPGYVRAVVSRDVRSFDGSQVLIPRSSRLIGQYKSGLQAGQTRAYVIWQRLIRPDGASVALGSPAVDFAGTAGLAGKVDGHFMKRFGSAVLLSVVGGLGAIGSSGTSVVLSSSGQSAASVAAGRDAAIPPTVRVAQGQPIRVFTARDLDFSGVGAGR